MSAPSENKTDLWMPLWIGDYLADTMDLTRDLHGGYVLLLMAYWRNRGPLPDDQERLLSIMKAAPDEWPRLKARLLDEFFMLDACSWHHKRADAELLKAGLNRAAAKAKASRAAAARWAREKGDSPSDAGCSGGVSSASPDGDFCAPSNTPSNAPSNAPGNAPGNARAMLGQCPSPSPPPARTLTGSSSVAKATAALGSALGASLAGVPDGSAGPTGAAAGLGVKPPATPPPAPGPASTPAPGASSAPGARQGPARGPVELAPPGVAGVKYAELTPEETRKRDVWRAARRLLAGHMPEKRLSAFCGKLAIDHGFDAFAEAVTAATQASASQGGLGDPLEYLKATCQRVAGERPSRLPSKQAALEASNDAVLREWLATRQKETIDESK